MDATARPLIAALLIAYPGVSARLQTTVVTQAMVFVLGLRRLVRAQATGHAAMPGSAPALDHRTARARLCSHDSYRLKH